MGKVNNWIKGEFGSGYSMFDKCFMIGMLLLQIIVFIVCPDTPLGIISGISGVISVVLCAKGKISFYFIGFVQTISYLILAWQNYFYGEVIENIFYLVTMVWGIFVWKDNSQTDADGAVYVEAKKFTPMQWILSVIGTGIATVIVGYILTLIGSHQAYTDAATNVLAIFAQLLMVRRYKEQWIWWLVIDILCLKMWIVAGNMSMVAMYIAWTINCIYGWYNWTKLNNKATFKKE
jgi:nicotinamide mononucleotide transporter